MQTAALLFSSTSLSQSSANLSAAASQAPIETDALVTKRVSVDYQQSSYRVSLGHQQESLTYQKYSGSQSVSFSQSSTSGSTVQAQEGVNASHAIDNSTHPLTDGARNILSHIQSYISGAVASGATDEEVGKLFDQGLAGFKQGYGEAETILSDLGQLNDIVQPSINQLYDEVISGISQLREQYLPQETPENIVDQTVTERNTSPEQSLQSTLDPVNSTENNTSPANTAAFVPASSLASKIFSQPSAAIETLSRINSNAELPSYTDNKNTVAYRSSSATTNTSNDTVTGTVQQRYERTESFSFSLTTQEGDKVTIKADSFFQQNSGFLTGSGFSANTESTSLANSTFFSIEGDLNEEEVIAITELLGQVASLADEFYYGDLEKAYNQALDIGYDSEEIAAYTLDLRLTETQQVASYIEGPAQSTQDLATVLPNEFALIDQFVKDIINIGQDNTLYQLFDISDLLKGIAQGIDENVRQAETSNAPVSFSQALNDITQTLRNL